MVSIPLIHDTQQAAGRNYNKNKGTNYPIVDDIFITGLDGANRGVHPSLDGVYSVSILAP
jgi:hypothetical protein